MIGYHSIMGSFGYEPIKQLPQNKRIVYHARNQGKDVVIKTPIDCYASSRLEHSAAMWLESIPLLREKRALELANGVDGVAQLVDFHGASNVFLLGLIQFYNEFVQGKYNPIMLVQQFIDGREMGARDSLEELDPDELLEETVRNLHKLGIARLDMNNRRNIILNSRPYLVDFEFSLFRKGIGRIRFEDEVGIDLRNLERLHKPVI